MALRMYPESFFFHRMCDLSGGLRAAAKNMEGMGEKDMRVVSCIINNLDR